MRIVQLLWQETSREWIRQNQGESVVPEIVDAQLVLYFGHREQLLDTAYYDKLRQMYPQAQIAGCSTGGEILGIQAMDGQLVAVAVYLEQGSTVQGVSASVFSPDQSFSLGMDLGCRLKRSDLKAVFVLSDGLNMNGSELVQGMHQSLPAECIITGGLAGDGAQFQETWVGLNQPATKGKLVMIGLYGEHLQIGHGSRGGWDHFGPKRQITKARGNILYELDGQPALELYARYLGDEAANLPGSALMFPLMIYPKDHPEQGIVRTIVQVDQKYNSMIFAGEMPVGYSAQLMRGYHEHLIDGAAMAGQQAILAEPTGQKLAILISCIGRKLLMGQMISDEIETCMASLGQDTSGIGFYSYGEISPHEFTGCAQLHNQTMTVTTIAEIQP